MMANFGFAAFLQNCPILIFVLFYTLNENVTSAVHENEKFKNSNSSAGNVTRSFDRPQVRVNYYL